MLVVCKHSTELRNVDSVECVYFSPLFFSAHICSGPVTVHSRSLLPAIFERGLSAPSSEELPSTTGLLLVYPQVSVAFLEACSRKMLTLVQELERCSGDDGSTIASAKVAGCNEDSPGRVTSRWLAAFCPDSDNKWNEQMEDDESQLVETTAALGQQCLELARRLCELSEADLSNALHSIKTLEPPHVQHVVSVVASDGAPTVDEFLDIFDSPPDVEVESEKTEPAQRPIIP